MRYLFPQLNALEGSANFTLNARHSNSCKLLATHNSAAAAPPRLKRDFTNF